MSEGNPVTGRPYGGRDEVREGAGLPGERPLEGDEKIQTPPASRHDDGEQDSRAPTEGGVMGTEPSGGTPGTQDASAPSPGDPTAGDQSRSASASPSSPMDEQMD